MRATTKLAIKVVSLLIVISLAYYVLTTFDINEENYREFANNHLQNLGYFDTILFIAFCTLLTCFAIPRQLLSLIGGFVFGPVYGTLFTTIGTTIGCILVFNYARFIAQNFVQRKFVKQIAFIEAILTVNTFAMTIVIRLLPMGAGITTNLVAGTAKISAKNFFLGTFLGFIPQNFIFALLASNGDLRMCLIISGILYAFSILLGYVLYRKYFSTNKQLIKNLISS